MRAHAELTAARLLVKCLENAGVEYIFGIPGEENIQFAPQALRAQMAAGRRFSPTSEVAFFSRKPTRVHMFVFLSG